LRGIVRVHGPSIAGGRIPCQRHFQNGGINGMVIGAALPVEGEARAMVDALWRATLHWASTR
jgi:hypothetical protein